MKVSVPVVAPLILPATCAAMIATAIGSVFPSTVIASAPVEDSEKPILSVIVRDPVSHTLSAAPCAKAVASMAPAANEAVVMPPVPMLPTLPERLPVMLAINAAKVVEALLPAFRSPPAAPGAMSGMAVPTRWPAVPAP